MGKTSTLNPAFRKAAVAFVHELDRVTARWDADDMTPQELEHFAHQICGAGDIFGARQTAKTSRAVERAVRGGADMQALRPLVADLATSMRADAARLRIMLDETTTNPVPGPSPMDAGDHPARAPQRRRQNAGRVSPQSR